MNYKFSKANFFANRSLKRLELKSKVFSVVLTTLPNEHIGVQVWREGKRVHRDLWCKTSVKPDLTAFEAKVIAIHVFKLLDQWQDFQATKKLVKRLDQTNYAEIFGSPWI
jgi:hypothetical protein